MRACAERLLTLPSLGLEVHVKEWHAGDHRVLCLPGWLDNANSFDTLAPLLPHLHLVAVDMPGHGRSQHRSADAQYHFADWIDVVMDLADVLGWDRFSLMGHSMGAAVSMLVAGTFPERIERLILLDALGPLSAEADVMPERMVAHIQEQSRLRAKRMPVYATHAQAAALLAKIVPGMTVECAEILLQRGLRELPEGGYTWSSDPRLRGTSAMRLTEAQVLAFVRRITCASLLIVAESGYPFEAAQMQARAAALRGLRQVRLPGGHHVHLVDPAPVAAAIEDFWSNVAATDGRQSPPPP